MRRIDDNLISSVQDFLLPKGCNFDDERRNFIKELSSCDLLAVPGSGKTTALIAKLCCMAENLEIGDAILVLSHTNTAVEEIRKHLSQKAAKLFEYPHNVSTIQEFVDKFLAIPYYENKYKRGIEIIDKDRYDAEIQRILSRCWDRRILYCKHQFDFTSVRFISSFGEPRIGLGIEGSDISYKIPTTWRGNEDFNKQYVCNWLLKAKNEILEKGILHYDDCYYLAEEYIKEYPEIKSVLQKRFKYILIDETQDMQLHQLNLIDKLFYSDNCILQRIGDPNQSIYNAVTDTCDWLPRNPMYINNSLRLSKEIADVVNPFTLITGDDGTGKARFVVNGKNVLDSPILPTLLLFNEETMPLLKGKFKDLIERNNLQNTINGKKYGFHIIGWNAKISEPEFNIEKLRLDNIFPNTTKVTTSKTYDTISEFLQFSENETISQCQKTVFAILCHILRLSGVVDVNGRNFTIKTLLKQYKNNELIILNQTVFKISVAIKQNDFETAYKLLKQVVDSDLKSKFELQQNAYVDNFIGNTFVKYNNEEKEEEDSIPIKIGTVHSVKGMTHCATMYVETFFHNYECKHLIKKQNRGGFQPSPFFKDIVDKKSSRAKQAMKMLYVGMSRPTHLLCYASLKMNWSSDALKKMRESGWEIIDLTI